jgi:tetratricopeptide (TPR) repeat protein
MRLRLVLSLALSLCWSEVVSAQSDQDLDTAREIDERAQRLFEQGEIERALALMEAAQAIAPASPRLYNMAVCHDRLGQEAQALELYREFTLAPDAPADRRARAAERIERIEGRQSSAEDRDRPVPVFEPPPRPPSTPPRAARSPRPAAFWALFGLTSALGVTTAILGGVTLSRHEQWLAGELDDSSQDRGQALATTADVFIGLTAASALAALIVAFIVDWSSGSAARARPSSLTAGSSRGAGASGLELALTPR